MRDELKAYVARHNLTTELEEPVKDVLQVYDISEDFEKLKISAETSQEAKKADNIRLCRVTDNIRQPFPFQEHFWLDSGCRNL
jgi:hypothetical protein